MLDKMAGMDGNLSVDGKLTQIDNDEFGVKVKSRLQDMREAMFEDIKTSTCNIRGSKIRKCPDDIRKGFKVFKYMRWFSLNDDPPVIYRVSDAYDIRTLAKFRCGMHWLASEKDRVRITRRSERKCALCVSGDREDELHILMCAAYKDLRHTFQNVFDNDLYRKLMQAYDCDDDSIDDFMKAFMNQKDENFTKELVGYLRRSITVRNRSLSG
jgi:hypothetical protein